MSTFSDFPDAIPASDTDLQDPTGEASLGAEKPLAMHAPEPELDDDAPGVLKSAGAGKSMLRAISTLLALTPKGRATEITRLKALAHGFIGVAEEEELVSLAKAVACRNDLGFDLSDRLALTNMRAADTLVRANALSDEAIAALIERGDGELKTQIARHHRLAPKHITMLVADGSGSVLQALLDNHYSHMSDETQALLTRKAEKVQAEIGERLQKRTTETADPQAVAEGFADLDGPARRAVMRRLVEDSPKATSMPAARKALDPTRNEADLTFLTVIESRDPERLRDTFADMLELDTRLVGKLMDEADGEAMMVLSRAAGLSTTAFARLVILSRLGLTGSPRDTFALVDRFKALPETTAQSIVQAMRKSSGSPAKPSEPAMPNTDRMARSLTSIAAEGRRKTAKPLNQQGFRRAI
ncbi:MAG: hypothetical protein AAGH43_05615 [Pseudomonadota bacterium]